ncbi:hypothetical protein [Paenibacillus lemnae]|uniref:Uncharacterized protein n=1 Tax=Paenibacillus lemnae TaxID=1330551 RepID=A0A848M642_PAELE|nr:hypothetical protein [Paenibacillus lemnae]NMO96437.1 hypothetical protein [Paenibacillus lemnae]
MKSLLLLIRSISIPTAIIIGFKPLINEKWEWQDLIFPLFMTAAVVSQLMLNRMAKEDRSVSSNAGSSDNSSAS